MKKNLLIGVLLAALMGSLLLYVGSVQRQRELESQIVRLMTTDLRRRNAALSGLIDVAERIVAEDSQTISLTEREKLLLFSLWRWQSYDDVLPAANMLNELQVEWGNTFGENPAWIFERLDRDELAELAEQLRLLRETLSDWTATGTSLTLNYDYPEMRVAFSGIQNILYRPRP